MKLKMILLAKLRSAWRKRWISQKEYQRDLNTAWQRHQQELTSQQREHDEASRELSQHIFRFSIQRRQTTRPFGHEFVVRVRVSDEMLYMAADERLWKEHTAHMLCREVERAFLSLDFGLARTVHEQDGYRQEWRWPDDFPALSTKEGPK